MSPFRYSWCRRSGNMWLRSFCDVVTSVALLRVSTHAYSVVKNERVFS